MGAKESTARLFAFMFAFSGWTTYYLWFNHFMEVAVVFPLIFLGIEKVFKEKNPFLLIVSLGLMGLANYFFLVTVCFIGVLYAIFRYFQLIKTFKFVAFKDLDWDEARLVVDDCQGFTCDDDCIGSAMRIWGIVHF